MFASSARVATPNAGKYLQQLCKHWAHNLDVTFTPDAGHVVFPRDARGADWPAAASLDLKADDAGLECRLQASHPDQLAGLKGAVERHLDRFAFREAPLGFVWKDAA
jgi:hypothetical protein